MTTPIVRAVKQQLGVELHFVTMKRFEGLLIHNPYVDQLFTLDDNYPQLINSLKQHQYDLVLDLHKSLRSRRITNSLKVKSVRFDKINIKKWLMVNLKIDRLPRMHLVDRYFKAFGSIGIQNDGKGLDYFFSPTNTFKEDLSLPVHYYVLVLGATYETKRIPTSLWIDIINKSDRPLILIGGNDVLSLSNQLMKIDSSSEIINYCGKINIEASAYIIQNSDKVISGDTGMMHIAAALQKPIISIWGNTIPAFGMYPYYGLRDDLNTTIEVEHLSCRPCSKIGYNKCPKGHFKCMNDIRIEDIQPLISE